VGVVICDGVKLGDQKCCVANPGISDDGNCEGEDRDSEANEQYYIEDGSPCYFKKGQTKTSYFVVCESDCSISNIPTSRKFLRS